MCLSRCGARYHFKPSFRASPRSSVNSIDSILSADENHVLCSFTMQNVRLNVRSFIDMPTTLSSRWKLFTKVFLVMTRWLLLDDSSVKTFVRTVPMERESRPLRGSQLTHLWSLDFKVFHYVVIKLIPLKVIWSLRTSYAKMPSAWTSSLINLWVELINLHIKWLPICSSFESSDCLARPHVWQIIN